MKHWYAHGKLPIHFFSDELTFSGRKVFFASSSQGTGGSQDPEDEKKNPKNPLDSIRQTVNEVANTARSKSSDDLVSQLEKLKSEGKITSTVFENAKRCARSSIGADRMLATRLIEGSITNYRFNKLYTYLHGTQGDAHDIATRKQAADLELTGKISPTTFDKVAQALESDSDDHRQVAENFLKNPKTEKAFLNYFKTNPLKASALPDILGTSALELEENRVIKNLTAFKSLELNDYLKKKYDTPKEAEQMRQTMEEFKEGSRIHSETYGALTRDFNAKVGKGNKAITRAFQLMISYALPQNIEDAEAMITRDMLDQAMEKTGMDLKKIIPEDFQHLLLEKLRYLQELEQKLAKLDAKIKKDLRVRELVCEEQQRIKNEANLCSRTSGINLRPGTKIRYRMPVYHDGDAIEYRWVETEIEGVFIEKPNGETVEYEGKTFNDGSLPLVVVTGAGRETLGRFKKWVMDTEAHQIIETKEELDREIQFDAMKLPLAPGMQLQQRILAGKDKNGKAIFETHLPRIEKLHDNGMIELDQEVDVYRAGSGTVRGMPLSEPIRKKVFTYGEFAQWIKHWNVLPHLTKVSDAENAYNNWKQVHGDKVHTDPVSFGKGSVLATGPYENTKKLTITDITKNPATGSEKALINGAVLFDPTQLLRAATNGHYRTHGMDNMEGILELERMAHDLQDHDEASDGDTKKDDKLPKETDEQREARQAKEKKELITHAEKEFETANTESPQASWLRTQWDETHFLTTQDVYQLGKAIWEYWNRRWERRMKHRYSRFGANMPFIGAEMFKIKEDAEHEEVGKYKHAYENMPYNEVRGILNNSSNQDEIRACIEVLVDKGQMRWDDVRTWEAINRVPALANNKKIPIPKNRDPYAIVGRDPGTGTKKNGMDYIADAVKSIWGGEDIFDGWESKNNSAYKSGMEKWLAKGEQLENDPKGNGGVSAHLRLLLSQHRAGEQVDPQEFEGLINFVIKAGKSDAEHKLYLIVMGVATNLLTIERVGALDSSFLNVLPWLDFFTEKNSVKPVTLSMTQDDLPPKTVGEGRPFSRNDYKAMAKFFEEEDSSSGKVPGKPGPNVKNFLWKKVLPHKATLTRTQKGSRNADAMDHDDSHFILPLLDHQGVKKMVGSSTGNKNYFSGPGYRNGYPGFSEWMKTLAEIGNEDAYESLITAIEAYVTYDALLTDRYEKKEKNYFRITESVLNKSCVVDPHTPVNAHRNQMENLILQIGKEAKKDWRPLFKKIKTSAEDPDGKKQAEIDKTIDDFRSNNCKEAIKSIGPKKLFEMVKNANLKGYEGNQRPEDVARMQEENKKAAAALSSAE